MVYAMSDIHGQYDAYMQMIDTIKLSPDDILYIIGDVIGRGENGIKILRHVMERDNIVLLRGNSEQAALDVRGDPVLMKHWFAGLGGEPTHDEYNDILTDDERQAMYNFLEQTPLELHIVIEDIPYHLIHGKPHYHEESDTMRWREFNRWEVKHHPTTEIIIFGNTPTDHYQCSHNRMSIFYGDGGLIGIDCGCGYGDVSNSRLACLRLNDWQEFYVII